MTLTDFFKENNKVALAFSGGVDSAYLLYAAINTGATIRAYYVKTQFQPEFEYEDALRLAGELGADICIINMDVLKDEVVKSNPQNRCYYCKKRIFSEIVKKAAEDGFTVILDGTNASDDADDRPGMKALKELSVKSPLRECGLTKDEIRSLSKKAGLFTWNKPAYACLATRIPWGEEITEEKLSNTEVAEGYLSSLGFSDFRVRYMKGIAKIQIREDDMELMMKYRKEIVSELKKNYSGVMLDMEVRG